MLIVGYNKYLLTNGLIALSLSVVFSQLHIRITWEAFETGDVWAYPEQGKTEILGVWPGIGIFQKLLVNSYLKAGLKIAVLNDPVCISEI